MKSEIRKERTHLFAPSINIACMVSFIGVVEDFMLHAAIQTAVSNNEVLNTKITMSENGDAFYEAVEPRKVYIDNFYEDWEEKVTEQEKKVFDLQSGELIRFFVKNNEDTTQLLIIAHHLVGDGLSITYFVEDTVNALNGKNIEYKTLKLYDRKDLPPESKLNPLMLMMLKNINRKWNKTGKVFVFQEYEKMFQKYWESRKTQIITAKLEESHLTKLEKASKLHKISINSILTTALLKIVGESTEIGISVSLREKDNKPMANYSTAISISHKYDETKDFWENARNVHNLIYAKLNNEKSKYFLTEFMNNLSPTLIDSAYFAAFDGYLNSVSNRISNMFGYSKEPTAINFSNLTRVMESIDGAAYKIKDFYFVPPIVPNAAYMFGVATYHNQLVVTLHALDSEDSKQKKQLMDNLMKELIEL